MTGLSVTAWLSDTRHLFLLLSIQPLIVVAFVIHDGDRGKILRKGRRLSLPLESSGLPGIVASNFAVAQRPGEVKDGQEVAHAEDGCTGSGENVEHLELGWVGGVAPRHAEGSKDELRE